MKAVCSAYLFVTSTPSIRADDLGLFASTTINSGSVSCPLSSSIVCATTLFSPTVLARIAR